MVLTVHKTCKGREIRFGMKLLKSLILEGLSKLTNYQKKKFNSDSDFGLSHRNVDKCKITFYV